MIKYAQAVHKLVARPRIVGHERRMNRGSANARRIVGRSTTDVIGFGLHERPDPLIR